MYGGVDMVGEKVSTKRYTHQRIIVEVAVARMERNSNDETHTYTHKCCCC